MNTLGCFKVPMTGKFCLAFPWLHCKDHLKLQYNFFGRVFVTVFLVEIFNLDGYTNNHTTCDITLHNDFQKSCIYLRACLYDPA